MKAIRLIALTLLVGTRAFATVTIDVAAAYLKDASGTRMPVNGLVILVASPDGTFAGPTPTSFVGGDDFIVTKWDLSAGEPGGLLDTTGPRTLATGNLLQLYWFPTLTLAASVPGGGIPYGQYRTEIPLDGSDPWVTPPDGSSITLRFLTTDAEGSNPSAAGNASLVVQKIPATVTLANLTHTYDGAAKTPTATTTPAGLTVNFTYDGSPTAPVNAGTSTVIGTINDPSYTGSATNTLTIAAKPVTPVIAANDKTYDGTTAATLGSQGVTGTVGADVVTLVVGAASFDTKDAGLNKTVTASALSLSGANAGNYVLSASTATDLANIAPKPVTPSIIANDKIYDGTTAATLNSQTVSGTIGADVVTLVVGAANFDTKDIGANKTVTASSLSLSGTGAGNYVLDPPTATDFADITAKTLTITANNRIKTYGQALTFDETSPSTDFTVAGLIGGDAVASLTLTSAGAASTASVAGSPYTTTPSAAVGTGLGNYTINYVSGNLTVTPATLTITANNRSKTYGQAVTFDQVTPSSDFTVAGLVNADTVDSVTLTSAGAAASAGVSGSPYAITPSAAVGTGLGNYTIGYINGNLTVTPVTVTPVIVANNKVYDGTTAATLSSQAVNGTIGSDVVTLGIGAANFDNKDVGINKTVTASSLSLGGAQAANYVLGATTATDLADITARTLTITANNRTKTYGQTLSLDQTAPSTDFTVGGLVPGDTVESVTLISSGTAPTANVSGSPYLITPSVAVGTGLANYTISYANGILTVTPAALTVTANNRAKTYGQTVTFDQTTPSTDFSVGGLVNADTVDSVTLTSAGAAATAGVSGSPYAIIPSAATGTGLNNYSIGYANGNLTVTPATLTITANNRSKTYGQTVTFDQATPSTDFTIGGLLNADTVDLVALTSAGAAATAGVSGSPYTIVPSAAVGSELNNYLIGYVNGNLTVTPAALTITAASTNKVYGAPLPAFTGAFTGFVNGENPADLDTPVTFTTPATQNSDVGTYPIQPTANDANYTITFSNGTLTITPAGTTSTLTSSTNPALPGQSVTLTFTVSAVAPSTAVPPGNVLFRIDGVPTSVPLVNGVAVLARSTLSLGAHTVEAEYASSANLVGTTNRLTPDQLINTPPVAAADQIERNATNGAKVLVSTLLANDSDADGDTLAFVSFSTTTTNGGTITRQGDWIYYTAPAGFTNDDFFTYSISDGRGQPVVGTVAVRIMTNNVPSPNLVITSLGNGSYRIRFDGIPGVTYRIEYSEGLTPASWQTLGSATANETGMFQMNDTPPAGSPTRFYRSVYP